MNRNGVWQFQFGVGGNKIDPVLTGQNLAGVILVRVSDGVSLVGRHAISPFHGIGGNSRFRPIGWVSGILCISTLSTGARKSTSTAQSVGVHTGGYESFQLRYHGRI